MTNRRSALLTVILGITLGVVIILLVTKAFGAPQSVSIDTATKQVINPIVKFGSGNTLDGTGATITGFPGSSYTFANSLLNTAGTVKLVNDTATPGNSKYYGTDSGGTRGYFNLPSSGSGTFIDLDFTGNNLTFMNGTTMWKSTGDDTDPASFTLNNSSIRVKDANNVEILGIWTGGQYGTLFIGNALPSWLPESVDNTVVGIGAMTNLPDGVSAGGSTAVGKLALRDLTTGSENTAFGYIAGVGIEAGSDNVFVGGAATSAQDASNLVLVGDDALADTGVTTNGIGIGQGIRVTTNNTAVIGNSSITDVYFGSTAALAKIHASNLVGGFTAHFSRGGAALQVNDVLFTPWTCPYSGTITGYSISANTGTCTLKTWKKANGTAIPTIADVISTSGVALSSGTHIRSATVSDFTTTAVTAGDMFMAQVTATSGPTDITFQVEITR